MIVAGLGCTRAATVEGVITAIGVVTAQNGLEISAVSALATGPGKANETALRQTAGRLGLKLLIPTDQALLDAAPQCLSHSAKSMERTGLPSLCEAAALAVAGKGSRLVAPRLVVDGVTCALARSA